MSKNAFIIRERIAYAVLFLSFSQIIFADPMSAVSGSDTSVSARSIFQNIDNNLHGISQFITALFYIVGISLAFGAVLKLKKFGQRTSFMHVEAGLLGPAVQLFVGVALVYSPALFKAINNTFWQTPNFQNVLNWQTNAPNSHYLDIIKPIVGIIQLVGAVAFLRGWIILTKATNQGAQPGSMSKGIVHIVGGVLALNITRTITVIMNTFGMS